jgi:hypothetical protein
MVYKALEAYRKAVCELEKADVLQPRNKEITRELLDCRHLKGKSQYWFREAIKQPRKMMGLRNVGVAEAYRGPLTSGTKQSRYLL